MGRVRTGSTDEWLAGTRRQVRRRSPFRKLIETLVFLPAMFDSRETRIAPITYVPMLLSSVLSNGRSCCCYCCRSYSVLRGAFTCQVRVSWRSYEKQPPSVRGEAFFSLAVQCVEFRACCVHACILYAVAERAYLLSRQHPPRSFRGPLMSGIENTARTQPLPICATLFNSRLLQGMFVGK